MKDANAQSGYSLVEVLVAISILLLATVGPMTIAARSLQYAQLSSEQNSAFFLAQEGIEAIFAIRGDAGLSHIQNSTNEPWGWMSSSNLAACRTASGCGIDWRDGILIDNVRSCSTQSCELLYDDGAGRARYNHQSGTPSGYTRVIQIESINSSVAEVTATVTWEAGGDRGNRSVVLQTYLHDIYETR